MLTNNEHASVHTIERYTEIERENRILLEKMTNILQNQRTQVNSANNAVPAATQSVFNTS